MQIGMKEKNVGRPKCAFIYDIAIQKHVALKATSMTGSEEIFFFSLSL